MSYFFVDQFSSLDDLHGKDRADAKKILAALSVAKRFSCFEVDRQMAKAMTWLCNHSGWITTRIDERVRDADGHGYHTRSLYPWTYVELTDAGRRALAEAEGK